VLVAGQLESNQRSFVARLDLQGRLMPAFGNGGMWQAPDDCTAGFELAAGAAGEIFAGGKCRDSLIVYKLDSQGVPVSSFGNGGAAVFGTRVGSIDALQVGAGGSVYVAGSLGDGSCKDLAVWKLDANGVPFANFGSAGIALPGIQAGGWSTLALDATGLLYAGASVPTCPTPDSSLPKPFVVVRLSG
jgi:hypothetical protein